MFLQPYVFMQYFASWKTLATKIKVENLFFSAAKQTLLSKKGNWRGAESLSVIFLFGKYIAEF